MFNHLIGYLMLFVVLLILFFFVFSTTNASTSMFGSHFGLELFLTVLPFIIIAGLLSSILVTLYTYELFSETSLSVYVLSASWMWQCNIGQLYESANTLCPICIDIKLFTSSLDVIHSLSIATIGFKLDSILGRSNVALINIGWKGISAQNCLELCGFGHTLMVSSLISLKEEEVLYYNLVKQIVFQTCKLLGQCLLLLQINLLKWLLC